MKWPTTRQALRAWYPALTGAILAARLLLPREVDELFFAEACGLGVCIIVAMMLNHKAA